MSALFEANISALKTFSPEAAELLEKLPVSSGGLHIAKTGHLVPLLDLPEGSNPVHSLYDPIKEARNVMSRQSHPCLLLVGFGGGYWPSEALDNPDRELVAVLDLHPEMTRLILEKVDWTGMFRDPRFRLLSRPEQLHSCYRPGIMGSLGSLVLPALERWAPDQVRNALTDMEQILEGISSDQATQGRLGRRWMVNTWRNLDQILPGDLDLPKNRRIWVTGAGPSLEMQLTGYQPEDLILAVDTALPCLQALGLEPDGVLTLDPQYYSLLHYLPGKPKGFLLRELGTSPALAQVSTNTLFYLSHNPLHLWLKSQGLGLPLLETRSGNVLGSLLSLAGQLSPRQIYLAGADMGYPQGQVYARETYQYHYHGYKAGRTRPLETSQTDLFFQGKPAFQSPGFLMTESQKNYRERLRKMPLPLGITQVPGKSPPLELTCLPGAATAAPFKNSESRVSFLKNRYYTELKNLPDPSPWLIWSSRVPEDQRLFFETLGPLLSWYCFHGLDNLEENWPIIRKELEEIIFTEGSHHGFEQH